MNKAMDGKYPASEIAKYVINYCHRNEISITNLKLQKLLYFLQGEIYAENKTKLISNDFYAWQLGPVVPEVYFDYCIYSSSVIPKQDNVILDHETQSIVDRELEKYAYASPSELVERSHQQDPWKHHYYIFGNRSIIPFESISNFFGRKERDNEG